MHDGIMVGVGTAINDDPRLNGTLSLSTLRDSVANVLPVRLLPREEHHKTPRPIILDPNLRLPSTAKLFRTLSDPGTPHAKAPWILCRDDDGGSGLTDRRQALEHAGGRVVPVPMPSGMFLTSFPSQTC